ncbi:hypothetical protein G6F40_014541 [Rhizopus arrhizus]|nr:hypothetical protein G6F40_014541 [Rhizopus arrhizus]
MRRDETGSTPAEMPLPQAWQQDLAGARFERQSIGVSRADVARVHRPGQADAFLKSEVIDAFSELGDEIARLRWLQAQGQPAPTVMATAEEAGRRWLLMSALPGRDLATSADLPPQQVPVRSTSGWRRASMPRRHASKPVWSTPTTSTTNAWARARNRSLSSFARAGRRTKTGWSAMAMPACPT